MKELSLGPALAGWLHRQWLRRGLWAWVMAPFSLVTYLVLAIRHVSLRTIAAHSPRAPIPVIMVGNLYIGGTGKTPVVIALLEQLRAKGWHPGVISRGYGVQAGADALAGCGSIDAARFGDEPALIARESGVPVSVHPNRRLAWQALLKHYPKTDVIVSDDGLQHATLTRDIELVVQDPRGVGNGWLLPAGPLASVAHRVLFGSRFFFLNFNIVLLGEPAKRVGVRQLFVLHQERHDRTAFARRKALENSLGRNHIKRRRFFLSKRTQPPKGSTASLQGHKLTHHFFDASGIENAVNSGR